MGQYRSPLSSHIPFLFFFQKEEVNWGSTAAIEPTEPPAPPIPPIISVAAAHQTTVDLITAFDVAALWETFFQEEWKFWNFRTFPSDVLYTALY